MNRARRTAGVLAAMAAVAAMTATMAVAAGEAMGGAAATADGITPHPVPTRVVVRVTASDAKVIGSGVGGARVTIRHRETGEVLAQGVQEGSTGSTERIMERPRERGATVYDTEGTAAFRATLDLDGPTPVEITARGPLGTPHAEQTASVSMVLLPGQHVEGEGVVLTLHGFTVEVLEPAAATAVAAGQELAVTVRITMLCGCPTEPGGMWDARRIDRAARLVDGSGRAVAETDLEFTGESSTYRGTLTAPEPGAYTLLVTAADAGRANIGTVRRTVVVQ